ncbi:hypothetical protein [Paenibacillus herberti]|uniref:hypothetical protein n=1 Tax=Paenibacillus herberti TaxID=1619309 RepID=UPI0015958CF5|nr:hypothetical protein [Paenibacillus herberti]
MSSGVGRGRGAAGGLRLALARPGFLGEADARCCFTQVRWPRAAVGAGKWLASSSYGYLVGGAEMISSSNCYLLRFAEPAAMISSSNCYLVCFAGPTAMISSSNCYLVRFAEPSAMISSNNCYLLRFAEPAAMISSNNCYLVRSCEACGDDFK